MHISRGVIGGRQVRWGGEVLEYALIAGLIVVAFIAVIGAVGAKIFSRKVLPAEQSATTQVAQNPAAMPTTAP